MNLPKIILPVFILGIFLPVEQTIAQRSMSYLELLQKKKNPSTFFDIMVLPTKADSTIQMVTLFSLSYDFLPFKKSSGSQEKFTSNVELGLEVFESDESELNKNDTSVEGLIPVERAFWTGNAEADNYKLSTSSKDFLKGHFSVTISPGIYSYIYELKNDETADSRLSSVYTINLEPYKDWATNNIILGDKYTQNENIIELELMAMGDNIPYGKDFYTLILIPDYQENDKYKLNITEKNKEEDTHTQVFEHQLTSNDIHTNKLPQIHGSKNPNLQLTPSEEGYTYALVHIPASEFGNNSYQISLRKDENGPTVTQDTFKTLWLDIPTSLLNLDVAIDMLQFIVDDNTLDDISSGSVSERKRKFEEFWEARDPMPETAYNELMAEYYRRIDYAYENFTSENNIGYRSDRGEIYIRFGAPKDIERKYPSNEPAIEIWKYPSRQFVFQATTGFGDFKLISN